MRILVTGKNGQLGTELAALTWPEGFDLTLLDRAACDLANAQMVEAAVRSVGPGIVVNAGAYTAVDKAESEPEVALKVNAGAPALLSRLCNEIGSSLIHVSTDYVFDGASTNPYREDDATSPLSVYGKTKEAGEAAIRNSLERHVIVRTSWVFSAHGTNFVKSMLRLATQKRSLRVVNDQIGCPTWAADLARGIRHITQTIAESGTNWGTYHFASRNPTSWYDFAKEIFAKSSSDVAVEPITTEDFGAPARRPANSVLDCARVKSAYGLEQPDWRSALDMVLHQLDARGDPR